MKKTAIMEAPRRGQPFYEGKAKILYAVEGKPGLCIQYFKDDATAFNAQKKGTIADKGVCNNKISARIFEYLAKHGVPTHLMRTLSDREMLVRRVRIIPIEVVVRNVAAGSFVKRLGVEKGLPIKPALVEFYYKRDDLGDPLVTDEEIRVLKLATPAELKALRRLALKINGLLSKYFDKLGLILVDFKLEFGRAGAKILLADEISPDTCRLWDKKTKEVLDKDRFRFDMGNVEGAYQSVLSRVEGRRATA